MMKAVSEAVTAEAVQEVVQVAAPNQEPLQIMIQLTTVALVSLRRVGPLMQLTM